VTGADEEVDPYHQAISCVHRDLKAQLAELEQEANEGSKRAGPERAAEIAKMEEFGLPEFLELTGITLKLARNQGPQADNLGTYGPYTICEGGVALPGPDELEFQLIKSRQELMAAYRESMHLTFPCAPQDFADWHVGTRPASGVGDFPINDAFFHTLKMGAPRGSVAGDTPVNSAAIIEAFAVKPDPSENRQWWTSRLRSAKKCEGLLDARVSVGAAKRPSTWNPRLVGAWLIEKRYLTKALVDAAVKKHFPGCDFEQM
jgi:hypothetical protein